MQANANQIPTTSSGGTAAANTTVTKTYPSGLTYTLTLSGASAAPFQFDGQGALNQSGAAVTTYYAPGIAVTAANSATRVRVYGPCAPSSGVCLNRGTVTLTFSQPVTNPVLHVAGLGGSSSSVDHSPMFRLTSPASGVTLSSAGGSPTNMNITATSFTSGALNGESDCNTSGTGAGCGSVRVNGTVTTLTFAVDLRATGSLSSSQFDTLGITASVDEDFSDAPSTSFNTAQAPSHIVGDLRLGNALDADNVNVTAATVSPFPVAAGADNNGSNGDGVDEDALASFPALALGATSYSLTVPISGASKAGMVCGWIDFNRNTTFVVAERACATFSAGQASVVLTWNSANGNAPTGLTAGNNYVRLRAGYTTSQIQTADGKGYADSGEVEDYRIAVVSEADLSITKTDSRSTYNPGQPLTYTIIARNDGPSPVTGARVTDTFPATITGVTWTCGAGTNGGTCGSGSGSGNLSNAVVNLPSGATVTFTATGTVTPGTNSNISNTATITGPASGGPTDPDTSNNSATDTDAYAPLGSLTCAANDTFVLSTGNNLYRIDTTGVGTPTLLATLPPPPAGVVWNGTGVSVTNNTVYVATNLPIIDGTPHGQVLAYNLTTGASVLTSLPNIPDASAGFVAGGVNPANGWFYSASPSITGSTNTTFLLYAYNPATGSAAPVRVGTITGVAGANGDLAFDAQGNLYLLAGSLPDAPPRIYRINAAAVLAGSGVGSLLPTTAVTPPFTGTTSNFMGLSFVNGEVVAAGGTNYQRFNPSTGALVGTFTNLSALDLASCQVPNTIRLQKTLPDGRVTTGDQFTLSITGGGLASGNTTTTTSTGTGLQTPIVGPVLGLNGTTFTITETAPNLANYAASWQCLNTTSGNASVGSGTGSTGSFVMPSGSGHSILCTFTNAQATRLTLQKTWVNAQVNDAATVSVTNPTGVGTPLNAVAGTASETDTGTPFTLVRGTTYTLTEAFTTGTEAQYARNLVCTGNTGTDAAITYTPNALSGTVTVGSTATNIVCTFTNTRRVTDVSIVKTAPATPVASNGQVVFTLVVTNHGPTAADGATLTDPAMAGLDCVAAGLPAPTCSATSGAACPSPLTATGLQAGVVIPTLPNAGVVTIGLTCRVTASGF